MNNINQSGMGVVKLTNKEAYDVFARITAYENSDYTNYLTDCSENRQYYYGRQYTSDDKDTIEDRGQYALVINKVRKAINGITGLLSASQPKFKVVPVGGEDNMMAALGNKLIDWVYHNSGGLQTFRKAVKYAARDNIGYLHVIRSRERNKIKYVVLGYDDVLVDPKSKDPLFRDAQCLYIIKWMDTEKVKVLFGLDELSTDAPSGFLENVTDRSTTVTPDKMYSADRRQVKVYEGYKKQFTRLPDGDVQVRIQKETLLGMQHVYREMLPDDVTEYPIVPIFSDDTENPYKRGEVHFLKGLQDFINKSYGITILNAQLMSNPKVFVRETDIPDMDLDKFKANYAQPGSVNVLTAIAMEPIVVQGQPLNSAFYTLYQDANLQFELATLPNDMLGYTDSQKMYPQSHLLDIREAVLDSLKYFAGNIEAALSQVGYVSLQYCKAYLRGKQVLSIVDAERNVERFAVNVQRGLDIENPQSVEMFARQEMQNGKSPDEIEQALADAKEDEDVVKSLGYLFNKVDALDVDIFVIPGSYAPSYEMANLRLNMELFNSGIVDGQAVLEHVPTENKEEILDRMSLVRQQANHIESLEQALNDIESQLKSTQGKLVNAAVQGKVDEEGLKQEYITKDHRTKSMLLRNLEKMRVNNTIEKIKIEGDKLLNKIENENNKERNTNKETMTSQDLSVIDIVTEMFDKK